MCVTDLSCVSQAEGVLQEYLLAMTTDEQLLNHTAMVRLLLVTFQNSKMSFLHPNVSMTLCNHAVPFCRCESWLKSLLLVNHQAVDTQQIARRPRPLVLNVRGLHSGLMYLVITAY